jgi:hypothetical protein
VNTGTDGTSFFTNPAGRGAWINWTVMSLLALFGNFCLFLSPGFKNAENGQKVPKVERT